MGMGELNANERYEYTNECAIEERSERMRGVAIRVWNVSVCVYV